MDKHILLRYVSYRNRCCITRYRPVCLWLEAAFIDHSVERLLDKGSDKNVAYLKTFMCRCTSQKYPVYSGA